ncbi:hypothetical protein R2C4_18760 [Leisingera aquaemixtae]|jgi:hypothetical protein|nr:hypothetical protein R2C4_18760 [Leisingera aquaemixtae]
MVFFRRRPAAKPMAETAEAAQPPVLLRQGLHWRPKQGKRQADSPQQKDISGLFSSLRDSPPKNG